MRSLVLSVLLVAIVALALWLPYSVSHGQGTVLEIDTERDVTISGIDPFDLSGIEDDVNTVPLDVGVDL